jgi:hypothetical protein
MIFPSIDIQGSILSNDLLAKIRSEQATYQQGKDFNPELTNAKLKDEISLAWQEAKGQWTIYKSKLARLKEGETGTTETRNFWISPLLTNLSYNLTYNRTSEELNGKSFPIGYRDSNLDNFPVYVGGFHESLDKRPENKQLRVSPHAMVQEYLNYSEHLYGIVTNGRQMRLLRDASRITRLSYIEFDLEKMMEEDLYSDFVILYRVLHASRMPKKMDAGAESIIEKYHQEGLEAGSTIRSKLGDAVKTAIKDLANGFITHPNNNKLREAVENGNFSTDEYYRLQLRIIYRLLFLFVIEERNLVYAESKTPETKRFNHIYFNHFSLLRLRKLAKKILPPEANRHYDIWQSLVSTFSLFEKKEIGEKLGIMALQGDLFGYNAIIGDGYDLHQCQLNNALLLNIIRSLSYFENDNNVLIAVNYGGLDVEEFGSVYEGLLELKLEVKKIEGSDQYACNFESSNERGKSGSHYTPEELVQPLIKHSLEYLIVERVKPYQQKRASKDITVQALLDLKVADVACGSGHILLSAARRLALEIARVQTEEEQPNPLAIRKAMKNVVRNCIYGVDKNPLAVELCKIALWLEAYNPGEPLNFLDHHIKCGDAIVGLANRKELEKGIADEAFKTLSTDDKAIASAFAKRNKEERKRTFSTASGQQLTTEQQLTNTVEEAIAEYKTFNELPESTPNEIESKAIAYKKFVASKGFTFLKAIADTQLAQFFIPKINASKDYLITDAEFRLILSGYKSWENKKVSKATEVALEQRFFHWFIEFPEVFYGGGFDCILGNPPYLGGGKISTNYGKNYLQSIQYLYKGVKGLTDLVAYFVRRNFSIIKSKGFTAIITTNTIAQSDTREGGLDIILAENGSIVFAVKSMKWPGKAAVDVSLLSIGKDTASTSFWLNNHKVNFISSYLDSEELITKPATLFSNNNIAFLGSALHGSGFLITENEASELLEKEKINKDVIKEFYTGDDLNSSITISPSRWVIYFGNRSLESAKKYEDCIKLIEERVKPEREKNNREIRRKNWWIFGEPTPKLYESINDKPFVFAISRVTKYVSFVPIKTGSIISDAIVVFASDKFKSIAILCSNIHESFCWKVSSTMGTNTLRYSPSDCLFTYPFPLHISDYQEQDLETIGKTYHEYRSQLMLSLQLGLTKTYNLFHCNAINANSINENDKQVESLQKHLVKTTNAISFNEAIQGILKLRELHMEMDYVVLDAYGWNDIDLVHDFYEVDYLPENDRVRFTIHPYAKKEVLKRLLELNHQIHEEEVKEGLWEKKINRIKKYQLLEDEALNIAAEPDKNIGGLFNQE